MLKGLVQKIIVFLASLVLTHIWFPGFKLTAGLIDLLITAIVFILLNWSLKPILKIIFLPLNILTLGFFRWVINALVLFTLSTIVPYVQINSFTFQGYTTENLQVPVFHVPYFFSLLLSAFLINLTIQLLFWLVED